MSERPKLYIYADSKVMAAALNQALSLFGMADLKLFTDYQQYADALDASVPDFSLIYNPHGDSSIIKRAARHKHFYNNSPIIICFGNPQYTAQSIEAGADYYLPLGKEIASILKIVHRIAMHGNLGTDEKALLVEKREFYNTVAAGNLFNERANVTADTPQELRFIIKELKSANCLYVFDAGCGNGRLTLPLAREGFRMIGGDASDRLISEAQQHLLDQKLQPSNCSFVQLDLLNTPFDKHRFDAVIMMWHVISDLRDHQEQAIREMHRVLRSGGLFIFDFPDKATNVEIRSDGTYENLVNGFQKYVGLVPDVRKIIDLLEMMGFKRIRYERFTWGIEKFVVVAEKS